MFTRDFLHPPKRYLVKAPKDTTKVLGFEPTLPSKVVTQETEACKRNTSKKKKKKKQRDICINQEAFPATTAPGIARGYRFRPRTNQSCGFLSASAVETAEKTLRLDEIRWDSLDWNVFCQCSFLKKGPSLELDMPRNHFNDIEFQILENYRR